MRLAQIARKVGMTPTDVKRFLESEFEISIGKEPNYKLDDDQLNAVLDKFPIPEPVVAKKEEISAPSEIETTEDDNQVIDELDAVVKEVNTIEIESTVEEIPSNETINTEVLETVSETIEALETETTEVVETETVENSIEETTLKEVKEAIADESVEISYDEPNTEATEETDALGFVEVAVDRNADLIKAPTVKLDGLKVLGKIELPEKNIIEEPVVTAEEIEQEEVDAIASLDAAMQSQVQDVKAGKIDQPKAKAVQENIDEKEEAFSEYKDSRGIYHFSHQQKANRAKAIVEIDLKRKHKAEKEKKRKHYEELMKAKQSKTPVKVSKAKQVKTELKKQKKEIKEAPAPKGFWEKFKRWLND